ncbi:hypothetical protein ASG22_14535 [Chryseobacterium sp. Leaf405]|uniref:hypothetical protein n=1 Tax=Chryseobacterium sp. Leaf405 TaxID=1736367 RepID=UPI000700DBFF|nr:hypothetical protein [Chryseobacterium sp. Leaf405]KQT22960.1 hypothetical protein ASG22_14535 [Chryseobacterium sp. Leaf405]
MSRLPENKKYLKKTLKIAELLYNCGRYNDCLLYIEKISHSAWFNFPGYYTINALESIIRNIALKNITFEEQIVPEHQEDRTLHVFSEIYPVGGHSKLMFNWIENDDFSKHYLLSTRQDLDSISEIAKVYNFVIDGNVFTYDKKLTPIVKAQKIANTLSENNFSRIILHIHPNDAIPSMVFSSEKIKSPVFFLNHAEHTFWLGAPIIDFLLQIRATNIQKDSDNRNIPADHQFFLPIPVNQSYNLKNGDNKIFNIVSMGTESKYEPNEEYNFLEEALQIVTKFDHVIFSIIGISANNHNRKKYQHERLVFVEPTRNISKYIEICDLYVEGFPVPSFTSLLESALTGIPYVLHYNPSDVYKVFELTEKDGFTYPKDIQEWHNTIEKMISDESYRKHMTKIQCSYVKDHFSLDAWKNKLNTIKKSTKDTKHSTRDIPDHEVFRDGKDEEIVSVIGAQKVDHYKFTERLGFFPKLKVVMLSFNNPSWVRILSKKKILRYLILKYI